VYYLQARLELTRVEPLTGLNNNDSTRVGVSDISKHASLLRYGQYYCDEKFYSIGVRAYLYLFLFQGVTNKRD
jgi:hypothetical protein